MTRAAVANRRRTDAGVTLVEILVVLAIIAITTGAAMLRLGIGRGSEGLADAATGMALAVTQASDAAMTTGLDRVLELAPDGYLLGVAGQTAVWHPLDGLSPATTAEGAGPWILAANAAAVPFALRISAEGRSVVVRFDGLRAYVEGGS